MKTRGKAGEKFQHMGSNKSLAINQNDLVMTSSSIPTTVIPLPRLNYCIRSKAGKKTITQVAYQVRFTCLLRIERKLDRWLRVTPESMPQSSREQEQRAETTSSWRGKEGKRNYLGH